MSMAPGRGSGCYAGFGHPHYVYFSLNLRCPFTTYSVENSLYCNQYYHISHDWHTLQTQNNIKLNRGGSDRGGRCPKGDVPGGDVPGGGCPRGGCPRGKNVMGGKFPVGGMS